MKTVLAAAVIAATALVGTNISASAATLAVVGTQYNSPKESGPFTDTYSFVLSSASDVYATFSGLGSLIGSGVKAISAITFGIYDSTGTTVKLAGSIMRQGPALTGVTDEGILAAGAYTIKVSDTYAKASGTYNGNLTVSSVPLPTSVALFGTAVLALGIAGVARRKRAAAV